MESRRRWTIEKTIINPDREYLQVVVIHPEEDTKVQVKSEHKHFYKRYVISGI
jgi:hypothetical protein